MLFEMSEDDDKAASILHSVYPQSKREEEEWWQEELEWVKEKLKALDIGAHLEHRSWNVQANMEYMSEA